jgi:ribosomal protein S12 methylthiotransferase accessory factor
MESLEVYCAEESQIPYSTLSYQQIKEQVAVIPKHLLAYRKNSLFHPELPEKWAVGWDLLQQREVAAPLVSITLNFLTSRASTIPCFQNNSNGLASGNHFLEAVSSAIYELIERDGASCHHFASTTTAFSIPRIRSETIPYPAVQKLLDQLAHKGIGVSLSDCSTDTEVPIIMATIWDKYFSHTGITRGYGAHLDVEVAMIRALTEAIQGRTVAIAGARDDLFFSHYQHFKKMDSPQAQRELEDEPSTIDAASYRSETTSTLEGDIHLLLGKLKKIGIEQVIVFDLSRPEFDVSVVRVIIPGMEGYYSNSYVPGERAKKFAAQVKNGEELSLIKGFHFPAGAIV